MWVVYEVDDEDQMAIFKITGPFDTQEEAEAYRVRFGFDGLILMEAPSPITD